MGGCRDFYGPFPQSLVMSSSHSRRAVSPCVHRVHHVDLHVPMLDQILVRGHEDQERYWVLCTPSTRRSSGAQRDGMMNVDLKREPGSTRPTIAFLLPVFNEDESIRAFHERLVEETSQLQERYDLHFIYVDDGSRDRSLEHLLALQARDVRVEVIGLSRNYGHQKAVTAAIDHCDAAAAIIMDTDLQDPPRVAVEMVDRWEQGADVVYAQRRARNDSFFKRATAFLFYFLLERVASIEIPRNTGDFRLLDRRVLEEVKRFREHSRFLRGLVSYVGFRQEGVQFDRDKRYAGTSGYPLRKMLRFAGDGIFGFSTVPLVLISRVGFSFSALSVVGILYALAVRIATPEDAVPGWAFLSIIILLIGGVQISMLGILGSYLGRVYLEVQGRPLYTVALHVAGDSTTLENIHRHGAAGSPAP